MKVGTLVRYTRFRGVDCDPSLWLEIVHINSYGHMTGAVIHPGETHLGVGEKFSVAETVDGRDDHVRRTIYDREDQLPDEWWVLQARLALLGEANE